jgi:Arc/MetJ-type ribon-helix-helix transcriptional regulator
MTIDLKPEQQRVIDLAVRSGAYRSPGEVLDRAFEIIREQLDLEDWMFEQREAIAARIQKGFAQAERGELIDGDAAVEMLRRRRAERRSRRDECAVSVHAAGDGRPRCDLVVYRRRQPGRCRPGGNGNCRYLSPAGETSPDGSQAVGLGGFPRH